MSAVQRKSQKTRDLHVRNYGLPGRHKGGAMKDFLFGAVYIIEQDYTDKEIKQDLENMKACGYNLVTLWPIANPWLAKSSHEWIFDKTIQVLDICRELGMKAVMQLFGQNQAQEFMPDSVLTEEMMIHDEKGAIVNENCFWANLNHPVVRDYFDLYFKEAILTLKDHPAVYGWDVFNEAHFRSDDEYTVREYQKWLEHKYKDIRNLNREWYRRYESFSQVLPIKRRSPYSIWSSLLPDVEYEKFRSENLTEICGFLYRTAKKYDAVHPVIIDGTSSQILASDVTLRNNDEFETAFLPDVYGATFYPKSWGRNYRNTPWTMAMYYTVPAAAARKAKKPYIVNELQTHTQSVLTPGSEVSPQELYNWMLMCIFTGACGMQLWRWRPFLHGYQSTGRGLTRIDGTPNLRSERTKELVSLLKENQDIFGDFIISRPFVKLAVSYSNRLFFDSLLKWNNSFWSQDVEGWYKLFWRNGLAADFANLERLDEEDMATEVIVLPSILSISNETAGKLVEYVNGGGILIADARLGSVNEYGVVPKEGIPGSILSELFGVRELDVSSEERFILEGETIPANYMCQKLEVQPQAEVLSSMEDGTPAVVANKTGKGMTLYFNSFMGVELKENSYPKLEALVMNLLKERHGNMVTARKDDRVHISYITAENRKAALVINFSERKESASIDNLPDGVTLTNIMTGDRVTAGRTTLLEIPEDTAYVYTWVE